MVNFITFLQAAQNGDGVLHAGFRHHDRLKPSFQGRILFNVFAVFVQRRRADGPQFATGQSGLKQVGGVHRPFTGARAHDGVQFVNEQDDFAVGVRHFLEEGFQAFFKFAAVFGPREHGPDVEGHNALVAHAFRHVTVDNAPRQAFCNGGLAHAGLPDEHGVVLGPAGKDLEDAADFRITADNGVNLAGAGAGRQVRAVFFQRLVFAFRVVVRHALVAAHFLHGGQIVVLGQSKGVRQLVHLVLRVQSPQHEVLHAEVVILELFAFILGSVHHRSQVTAHLGLRGSTALGGFMGYFPLGGLQQQARITRGLPENRGKNSAVLLQQRHQNVQGGNFRLSEPPCRLLRLHQRFLKFCC